MGRDKPRDVLNNPTLHPRALTDRERSNAFKWHGHAHSERSSQVFCISAFGTLRCFAARDRVLDELFSYAFSEFAFRRKVRRWEIIPEFEEPAMLGETGRGQPTSVDALCVSSNDVICIESKFVADAREGFGSCGQFTKGACGGFYGPGSDLRTRTAAWCRLESWEGERAPRLYWTLGRRFFAPSVFQRQRSHEFCPLRGPNYQLMRNFLFAVSYA